MHLTRRGRGGTQGEICTQRFQFIIIGIEFTPPDQVMKILGQMLITLRNLSKVEKEK